MTMLLGKSAPNGDGIVPGVSPQVFSEQDFTRISRFTHKQTGIVLSDGKRMLVYSRLAPILRQTGCTTFAEFLDKVEGDRALTVQTLEALTTNHTYFNREAHHFEHFANEVRPQLIAKARSGEPVRLWSAGCSTGQEIWNLMMVLLGTSKAEGVALCKHDLVALASDLSTQAVAEAKAATYKAEELAEIAQPLRDNWCKSSGDRLEIGPEARSRVRFRALNLLGEWPMAGHFDVIFCRNVMIYFDQPTKDRLVWRLADRLKPGGHLYIGHSERIGDAASDLLDTIGPTIYRRRGA